MALVIGWNGGIGRFRFDNFVYPDPSGQNELPQRFDGGGRLVESGASRVEPSDAVSQPLKVSDFLMNAATLVLDPSQRIASLRLAAGGNPPPRDGAVKPNRTVTNHPGPRPTLEAIACAPRSL